MVHPDIAIVFHRIVFQREDVVVAEREGAAVANDAGADGAGGA